MAIGPDRGLLGIRIIRCGFVRVVAMLRLAFIDDPLMMIGVLKIVFRQNTVTGLQRIAGK